MHASHTRKNPKINFLSHPHSIHSLSTHYQLSMTDPVALFTTAVAGCPRDDTKGFVDLAGVLNASADPRRPPSLAAHGS